MIQGGRRFLRVLGIITSWDKTHRGQSCVSELPQQGIRKINKLMTIKHFQRLLDERLYGSTKNYIIHYSLLLSLSVGFSRTLLHGTSPASEEG